MPKTISVNKGAVKFKSIAAMARSKAKETGEPYNRVYIRIWKRLNEGNKSGQTAYAKHTRVYVKKAA